MTEDKRAKLIDRIRRMQHVEGREPEEAELFMARAAQLIIDHNIAEHELAEAETAQPIVKHSKLYRMGNANAGVFHLLAKVGEVFGIRTVGWIAKVWSTEHEREVSTFKATLIGTQADIDTVLALADTVLIPQMMGDVARDRPRSRKSYCTAWAGTVARRLEQQQEVAYLDAGMALVPINPDIEDVVQELTGGRNARGWTRDHSSAAAGTAAGAEANLGGSSVGGGSRGAIGRGVPTIGSGS